MDACNVNRVQLELSHLLADLLLSVVQQKVLVVSLLILMESDIFNLYFIRYVGG